VNTGIEAERPNVKRHPWGSSNQLSGLGEPEFDAGIVVTESTNVDFAMVDPEFIRGRGAAEK
jgi:hypothetical protein